MTNKKLTDNEIIKALEDKIEFESFDENGYAVVDIEKLKNALDLITRQKAEIERLNEVYQANQQLINALNKSYFLAKTEAYKEFAERLKGYATQGFWESDAYVGAEQIDDLLKELNGG